jgi:hypothetical protein
MDERIDGIRGRIGQRLLRVLPLVGATVMAALLSGCISVKAPDKPIVIELNINIKQEVVYKLAADAAARSRRIGDFLTMARTIASRFARFRSARSSQARRWLPLCPARPWPSAILPMPPRAAGRWARRPTVISAMSPRPARRCAR